MGYEVRVRLTIISSISGALDFLHVTEALDLGSPSWTWKTGDRVDTRSPRIRRNDGMTYVFFDGKDCDPIEKANHLLEQLEARGDKSRSILVGNEAELSIALRLYYGGPDAPMETPPFHMTREFIDKLDRLGLELDLDLYVFSAALAERE